MSDPALPAPNLEDVAREGREQRAEAERARGRSLRERDAEAARSVLLENAIPVSHLWAVLALVLWFGLMFARQLYEIGHPESGNTLWCLGILTLPLIFLIQWGQRLRAVQRELAWSAALPFVLDGYFEAMASPPVSPTRLRVEMSFVDKVPATETVVDALGVVDTAATAQGGTPLVLQSGPLVCELDGLKGNAPVRAWLLPLVEQVLWPLHREYPLASVVVRRVE